MSKQASSARGNSKKLVLGATQNSPPSSHVNYNYFNRVFQINTSPTRCPHLIVDILGERLHGLLDSGASITVTSAVDILKRLNLKIIKNQISVQTANGCPLTCVGFAYIPYTFNGKTKVVPTAVIPEIAKKLILGTDFWKAFDIELTVKGKPDFNRDAFESGVPPHSICHVSEYQLNNICCTIQPDKSFRGPEEPPCSDESLDIPSIEIPNGDLSHVDEITTEHELTELEKQKLFKIVKNFPRTVNGRIGRTQLIQH